MSVKESPDRKKTTKTDVNGLVTTTVLNTTISEVQNKTPDTSSLITTTIFNTKVEEVYNKILDHIMLNILLLKKLIS